MIAQLLTAHPVTGAIRALTPGLLREALLLPRPCPFELLPALAAQTRMKLFDMAAADQMRMIGYHFPFPGLGHIRREGDAFEYVAIPMIHG